MFHAHHCKSHAPAHSKAISSHTHPQLCHHHVCLHLVWLLVSPIMFNAFVFLAQAYFTVCSTAFGPMSHFHSIALHLLSAIISDNTGSFFFLHWRWVQRVVLGLESSLIFQISLPVTPWFPFFSIDALAQTASVPVQVFVFSRGPDSIVHACKTDA